MYTRMDENRTAIQEALARSIKAEINKQVTTQSKAIKMKIARIMGTEIVNLQTQSQ